MKDENYYIKDVDGIFKLASEIKELTEPEPLSKLKRFEFTIDLMYWAISPCFNINFYYPEFEFEWLCFGIYFRLGKL